MNPKELSIFIDRTPYSTQDIDVMQVRAQGEDVVARIVGVADRNTAESLRGATVHIRRSH